ncbi:hypothetical protein [Halomonas sp. LBP4]|uniref:hypothetical protein n=1 Tax=Halomonas sp. LBP4 TaxID=2044917 RepID=UPI000D75A27B|nr:hypothetical protein [Halomonas sp. LBP4]PXX99684.1 hypothetical protein CR157_02630 [Halomonas sp. LBP4]
MGFFTQNTMSLDQMTHLVTYVAASTIGFYAKQGAWVDEDFRQKLVMAWLQENGHKASHWKLTKLALAADGVAKKTVFDTPELVEALPGFSEDDEAELFEDLYVTSRQALLYKGITN